MATLHELITKVIPLKGILRIPSYWMRKVLTAIADAVEAVNKKIDSKVELVRTYIDSISDKLTLKGDSLSKAIFYAKTGQPFFILDVGTKMIIDGAKLLNRIEKLFTLHQFFFIPRPQTLREPPCSGEYRQFRSRGSWQNG